MSIADILRLDTGRLTNQQIADMALQEDQAARRARARGDHQAAAQHDAEVAKLADMLQ